MQVASVDYDLKRIYLHADTVTNGFDAVLAYFEVNILRSFNVNNEQFRRHPYLGAEGNIKKTTTTNTPRFAWQKTQWRYVPYDQVTHRLSLKCEIVSEDEITDADVFDFSGLSVNVHIDKDYKQVEIITVVNETILTPEESGKLMSIPTAEENATAILDIDPSCP